MEFLVQGLLPRIPVVEKTRKFTFDIFVHPYRDAGIFNTAHDILRPLSKNYSYSVVMLDFQGCGKENTSREKVEQQLENLCAQNGWKNRSCAISIDPELENWIWVTEARLSDAISWDKTIGLHDWLQINDWKKPENNKPIYPKEALEAALKECRTPRSSSIYREISSKASYKNCTDNAFLKLLNQIIVWFK